MPRLVALGGDGTHVLTQQPFLDEATLQRLLEERPELLCLDDVDPSASPLVPIGREVALAGQALDLLFIDRAGRLTAVETKLRRNSEMRRQVVGQILEYGALLSAWGVEDVERQAADYLGNEETPARFRGCSLYDLLRQLDDSATTDTRSENDVRTEISQRLAAGEIQLVIAVDRIVDSLRDTVAFVNGASRFGLFLLEVQEHRGPGGLAVATVSVYGGAPIRPVAAASSRGRWDEERFLQSLRADADPTSVEAAEDVYRFIRAEADSPVWGTGGKEGSCGFGIRAGGGRFVIFWLTTKGRVWVATATLRSRVSRELGISLLGVFRSAGIYAPDDLLEQDRWLMADAGQLTETGSLEAFKSAVLGIRDDRGQGAARR